MKPGSAKFGPIGKAWPRASAAGEKSDQRPAITVRRLSAPTTHHPRITRAACLPGPHPSLPPRGFPFGRGRMGPPSPSVACDPNCGKPPNNRSSTTALDKNFARWPSCLLPCACVPPCWGACTCALRLLGPQFVAVPLEFAALPFQNLLRM